MKCPQCQHENRPTARFCTHCRAQFSGPCAQCGAELVPGDAFCGICGAPTPDSGDAHAPLSLEEQFAAMRDSLPASAWERPSSWRPGEERVVTVLFSRLERRPSEGETGADLPGLLVALVDTLGRHGALLDGFLGDSFRAFFGLGTSSEGDARKAVQSALEIRELAQQHSYRASTGLNTGSVTLGALGGAMSPVPVSGQAVQLAARLQAKAAPGQVVVGEATYRASRRAFVFQTLSVDLVVAGGPVVAYSAEAPAPAAEAPESAAPHQAAMIGRQPQLETLKEAYRDLAVGVGHAVALVGPDGVGKSRLVRELQSACRAPGSVGSLPDPGPLWYEVRLGGVVCGQQALSQLALTLFGCEATDGPAARGERIRSVLSELEGRGAMASDRAAEVAGALGRLVSARYGGAWDHVLDHAGPEQMGALVLRGLAEVAGALSAPGGAVLAIEDPSLEEPMVRGVLVLLAEVARRSPLLLICDGCSQPESGGSTLFKRGLEEAGGFAIRLEGLTEAESKDLLGLLPGGDELAEELSAELVSRSHGLPLFLEQALRGLNRGADEDATPARHPEAGPETAAGVPEGLERVISGRLDRLEPIARGATEALAVAARPVRRRVLEAILGAGPELDHALWEVEDQGLLRRSPADLLDLAHPLIASVARKSTARRRQTLLHQRFAQEQEGEAEGDAGRDAADLAYHYSEAGLADRAAAYSQAAGEKALSLGLVEESVRHFRVTLNGSSGRSTLGPEQAEAQVQANVGLGKALRLLDRDAEATEHFRRALALGLECGLPARALVRIIHSLAEALWAQRRYEDVIEVAERGLVMLGSQPDGAEAILMNCMLAVGSLGAGKRSTFREYVLRNEPLLSNVPYESEQRSAYTQLAVLYATQYKDPDRAMAWASALREKALKEGDLKALGEASHCAGHLVLSRCGRLQEALAYLEEASQVFSRLGDTRLQAWTLGALSRCHAYLGHLEEAQQLAVERKIAAERGAPGDLPEALLGLGAVQLGRGDPAAARETLRTALDLARERGVVQVEAWASVTLSRALSSLGEVRDAVGHLLQAAELGSYDRSILLAAFSGLESAVSPHEEFGELASGFMGAHPRLGQLQSSGASGGLQLRLVPDDALTVEDDWEVPRPPLSDAEGWEWVDPYGGSQTRAGRWTEVRAPNGRDLCEANLSAPRLVTSTGPDFVVEVECLPGSIEAPSIGGLLLWGGPNSYLRLDVGLRGPEEVSLSGCLDGVDLLMGRGQVSGQILTLRLECCQGSARALCRGGGGPWMRVGHVHFPVLPELKAGVFASGLLDRTVYPGEHREGAAARFGRIRIWKLPTT